MFLIILLILMLYCITTEIHGTSADTIKLTIHSRAHCKTDIPANVFFFFFTFSQLKLSFNPHTDKETDYYAIKVDAQ